MKRDLDLVTNEIAQIELKLNEVIYYLLDINNILSKINC